MSTTTTPLTPTGPAPSAQAVADLREKTGAGLLECRKALIEASGDVEAAIVILRKRLGVKTERLSSRATKEGVIESYIHVGGKVGVLIEVNCETDFVARNDGFKALVKDLCLQIAAANPLYVGREHVPESELASERDIAAAQTAGKPPAAVQKIVEGKLEKHYSTVCLLEQPFVKQPEKAIKDVVADVIAKLGENVQVRRFMRYQLGA